METLVLVTTLLFPNGILITLSDDSLKDCQPPSVIESFKETVELLEEASPNQSFGKVLVNLECGDGQFKKTFFLRDDRFDGEPA